MVNQTKTIKEQVFEITVKLSSIDRQLADLEKIYTKNEFQIEQLHLKIEKLKDDIRGKKSVEEINDCLIVIENELTAIKRDLKSDIDNIKLEMPEMRLIKKIVLGLVAFILTAFLGLLWNTAINAPAKKANENVEEIVKKLSQEYKKGP